MRALDVATRLPDPDALERLSMSIAALDVALSPEWESRYFSFDPRWTAHERMASMRNGSGDAYLLCSQPRAQWLEDSTTSPT